MSVLFAALASGATLLLLGGPALHHVAAAAAESRDAPARALFPSGD